MIKISDLLCQAFAIIFAGVWAFIGLAAVGVFSGDFWPLALLCAAPVAFMIVAAPIAVFRDDLATWKWQRNRPPPIVETPAEAIARRRAERDHRDKMRMYDDLCRY